MGSFVGHFIPGSFFILWALWWSVHMFHSYYVSRLRNQKFVSTATYPCSFVSRRIRGWPVEPLAKLLCSFTGVCGEMITAFHEGKFEIGNGQHATMYIMFGLTGIVDLLLFIRAPVPKDTDYVSIVLALLVEGILFKFHLHGRDEFDVLLHTLLIYTIAASFLAVLAEIKWRQNVLVALTRAYFVFLQGTWFWQVGFILYNPVQTAEKWNHDDHDSIKIVAILFAWHCGSVFVFMLTIGCIVAYVLKRVGDSNDNDIEMTMEPLIHCNYGNSQTLITTNAGSDGDTDCQ